MLKIILFIAVACCIQEYKEVRDFPKNEYVSVAQRPVRILPGLNNECPKSAVLIADHIKCVHADKGLWVNLGGLYQVSRIVCEFLKGEIFDKDGKVTEAFKFGFHLVGWSQGGLVARLVFHRCPCVRPYIRRLITVGTPNLGINTTAMTGLRNFLSNLAVMIFSQEILKDGLSITSYINKCELVTKSDTEQYETCEYSALISELLKTAVVLKKPETANEPKNEVNMCALEDLSVEELIQNQLEKKLGKYEAYEDNVPIYDGLEGMINIMFSEDELIHPPNSSIFGMNHYIKSENLHVIGEFNKDRAPNSVGLDKLWERNMIVSCAIHGKHLHFTKGSITSVRRMLDDDSRVKTEGKTSWEAIYTEQFNKNYQYMSGVHCSRASDFKRIRI